VNPVRFKAFPGITGTVIICTLSACDNVEFGGVQLALVPPPETAADTAAAAVSGAAEEAAPEIVLPDGPILYMATRSGSRVSVRPVAEIGEDGPRAIDPDRTPGFGEAFAARDLAPGTPLTLFAEGVRAGTMRIDTVESDAAEGFCRATPIASGGAEFVPGAGNVTRFLAMDQTLFESVGYQGFDAVEDSYEQRVAGLDLAQAALMQTGARWPPSVLETRADMQAIPLDGDRLGAFAATFMFEDRLAVGPPESAAAYSMLILGTGGPERYALDYVWYRRASDGGKAAARFFEQFDWDGDGRSEILLEVLGADTRWVAALDRNEDGWTTVFETDCS
jgi:hypothetical protein